MRSSFIISPLNYVWIVTVYRHFPGQIEILDNKTIYKKGNEHDVSNYRLVSLLTSFSKMF
jgi:hypothetical protein